MRRDKQKIRGTFTTGTGFTSGGGGGGGSSSVVLGHSALLQLDYANAGHTGFAPIDNPTFTTKVTTPVLKVTTGAAAGNILVSDASGDLTYLAAGTTTEILVGGGTANPVWTEATGTGAPVRAGSPTFTGTVTTPSLIVTDLTDGYVPYQKPADDKLSDSLIYAGTTNVGIGTITPGKAGDNSTTLTGTIFDVTNSSGIARLVARGSGSARLELIDLGGGANDKTLGIIVDGGIGRFRSLNDAGSATVVDNILVIDLGTGNIGLNTDNPSALLHVDGTSIFTDDLSTSSFSSGFAGSGWKLDKDDTEYSLTVDNLTVRKLMRIYELEINKISSVNGGILVSAANGKAYNVAVAGTDNIFTEWLTTNDSMWIIFTRGTGLNITQAENLGSTSNAWCLTNETNVSMGEDITITYTLTYNSSYTYDIQLNLYEVGSPTPLSPYTLSEGTHTINFTAEGYIGFPDYQTTFQVGVYAGIQDVDFSLDITITSDDLTTIYFDEDTSEAGSGNIIQFQTNDYVRAQEWTGHGINYYEGQVLFVNHSNTLGRAYIKCTDTSSGSVPWVGCELVQVGNSIDIYRQSIIYITASDDNNPYIDMLADCDDGDLGSHQILRIGNLTGITDAVLGNLDGYGLYCDNVYLTGNLILPNAGVLSEDDSDDAIRFWAGDTYANRNTAPFMVTDDGALTATGVVELGTAVGLDPESSDTNNVAIKSCYIYESSRNDDNGSLYINSIGHLGTIDHFRNTYIGDGKNGYLLEVIGESEMIGISKALAFTTGALSSGDYTPDTIEKTVWYLTDSAAADRTLTLPTPTDVIAQFGGGKSQKSPQLIIINTNETYDLIIESGDSSEGSTFWTTDSDYTKTYVLAPKCSIFMVFIDPDWYII